MNVAFLVQAHTDVKQVLRFVKSLSELGDVYVHVDKKTKDSALMDGLDNMKGAKFEVAAFQLINVSWGGYSQVRCQYALLRKALERTEKHYDRLFFLSGLDYMVYNEKRFVRFCKENSDREIVCGFNITTSGVKRQLSKIILYHFFRDIPMRRCTLRRMIVAGTRLLLKYLGFRKKPFLIVNGKKWDVHYGTSWFSLTGKCAEYVLNQLNENKSLEKYFSTSFACDEMVVPTIVFNSEFKKQAILGYIPALVELTPLHYLHYTDHIWTYDETEFDKIIASDKMFVRKIVSPKSDKLVEMIEQYKKITQESNEY